MALRKGQKELVEQYRKGFCAVPAIPGGGKTHCLSLWAVEMITQGLHKPGKILIVTYMNSAVNNFKQRIATELNRRGVSGTGDYFVSTIHGLCLQIIKEKPDLILANEDFEIIDGVNKLRIIEGAINEWRRKNDDIFKYYIDSQLLNGGRADETCKNWQDKLCSVILTAIGEFKCRGLSPREAKEKCRRLAQSSLLKHAADIYEVYDRRLKKSGLLDFDDMLYNAKKLLSEDWSLLEKYRSRYSFVCEDEAQDSNLIQSEILTMISDGNLLRVGDSNQAICGSFTSSDFKFFKEFCELPQTTVYNITESSRNTREIIDLANYFVRYVREHHPVPECRDSLLPQFIEPVGADDERGNPRALEYGIQTAVFTSWEEEAAAVVSEAGRMLEKYPEKTMAVLVPSYWKISLVTRILDSKGIPYEELESNSSERNKALWKLGRVIDFITLPENNQKFLDMLRDCFLSGESDKKVFFSSQNKEESLCEWDMLAEFVGKQPMEKLLYPASGQLEGIPAELQKLDIWRRLNESLDIIKQLLEYPLCVYEKLILFIAETLDFDRDEKAVAQKVAGDIRYLVSQNPHYQLSDLAAELLSPRNMFSHFANVVWELKGYEPRPGVVTIATYHKSKGLEWDTVFLTGLNYADFPVHLNDKFIGEYWFLKQEFKNPQAIIKADIRSIIEGTSVGDSIIEAKLDTISEKARLLYVGITRAKEYLYLSGFHSNPGRKNEIQPCKYLLELKKYIEGIKGQG